MSNTLKIDVNRDTVTLYLLARYMHIDYVSLVVLYEVYKTDIYFLFSVCAGKKIRTLDGNIHIHDNKKLLQYFKRANTIYDALQGKPAFIGKNDRRIFNTLESMYSNGKFIIEVS
jgi:hypothetical protein